MRKLRLFVTALCLSVSAQPLLAQNPTASTRYSAPSSAFSSESTSFSEGLAAFNQQNYSRAVQLFEHCQVTESPNAKLTLYCALANLNNKNKRRSEQLLRYLVKTFPDSREAKQAEQTLSLIEGKNNGSSKASTKVGVTRSSSTSADSDDEVDGAELASLPQTAKLRFRHGDNGHMLVDAYLNGHFVKAWFDTGASAFITSKSLKAAGISPPAREPESYTRGWAGKAVPMWRVPMKVTIGDLTRNLMVGVQQSSPDDQETSILPLIGQDFIKGYRYSIDESGGWIYLTKNGGESKDYNAAYDVPCIKRGKDDYVALEVNGKKIAAFIDTGAAHTIMDAATYASLGLTIPADAPAYGMTGVGGGFVCHEVELDLRLGPIRRNGFKVMVGGTAGNGIGQDLMKGWRFTVDHDRNLLRFFH